MLITLSILENLQEKLAGRAVRPVGLVNHGSVDPLNPAKRVAVLGVVADVSDDGSLKAVHVEAVVDAGKYVASG
jgi:hypothetical protein